MRTLKTRFSWGRPNLKYISATPKTIEFFALLIITICSHFHCTANPIEKTQFVCFGYDHTVSSLKYSEKPSRDLPFMKLWAATLRMLEMEKAWQKHQNGQVWSPWHYEEWDVMTVWRFVWKKLLESKALLSSNIFYRCTLNFPKIQTDIQTYSLMLETSNLAFCIFDMLIPFLALFKL